MAERLKKHGVEASIIRPWVFHPTIPPQEPAAKAGWTWIYSGNLGRAHEWESLLQAQQILERGDQSGVPITLKFQGGGPSWALAQERAAALGLKRVIWEGYVPAEDLGNSLMACDALVVTQRPEARGLLWPSKLGFALTMPRPLFFVGPVDGAIANDLKQYPHAQVFSAASADALAAAVRKAANEPVRVSPEAVFDPIAHRTAMREAWRQLIARL
jgi:glycosyltransferase involved in cell wall biosynthesis